MSLLKKLFPKIYDPELFHSKLNKRKFFENWEFKLISDDGKNILIIIPVLILGQNKLCYVEIVDGITGESYLINYPISHYKPSKGKMECYYSTSRFGKDGIDLSMSGLDFKIKGAIKFGAFTKYPSSVLSPGLMSYYSFVPSMESYFNLISRHHLINGEIIINEKVYNFNNGTSFIEKGWGKKYPDSWLMVHCNTFTNSNSSFFLSASPTNVLGTTIMGIQCFITYNNEIINFSTYNKGKITHFKKEGKTFSIELCNKTHRLNITAIPKQYGRLKVPSFRNKEWYIYESANAIIYLDLFKDNELLKCEEGINTGFELVEGFSELIESHLKSI